MESRPQTLLWIDDQIRPDDAIVRLLKLEGFHVDCAESGAVGLTMAQRTTYVGIILDLRLPDISGLSVLETLTRRQVPAPVLVLTGYPDFDAAVQAMRLGAWDCQSKAILLSDQWIGVLRALAEHGDRMQNRSIGLLSADAAIVRELLDFIDELHKHRELPQRPAEHVRSDLDRLKLRLLRTLADQRLNVLLLLVCAKALRLTLTPRPRGLPSVLRKISDSLNQAAALDCVTPQRSLEDSVVRPKLLTSAQVTTRATARSEPPGCGSTPIGHRSSTGRFQDELRDQNGIPLKRRSPDAREIDPS